MIARALALVAALTALVALPAVAERVFPASYPEGPVWIDGTLYWAEMGADRVMTWDGAKEREFYVQEGCGPTAVARYREDELLVLCHVAGELVRLDAKGRPLGTIREDAGGNRLRDPNDASADGAGGVWFSDPGIFSAGAPAEGALYYLAPDGTLTRHVTGLRYGNGVFVDRAGGRLLVSEHLARRVLAYPLVEGGGLGEPQVLFRLDDLGLSPSAYPEAGPDGLELAPDGTLWVAEYGAGRLIAWAPDGLAGTIGVAVPYVTNIAFAPDGRVAVTGSFVNDRPPFPGMTWVLPANELAVRLYRPAPTRQ